MSSFVPPFCPNPDCHFHRQDRGAWRFRRAGWFSRALVPHRIQRFRCGHCRRHFSTQTFSPTYWLKRPELLEPVFRSLLACSAYRQIGRLLDTSPHTVLTHSARLGRHCLLFHERRRPPVREPLCLDTFVSFEFSQYAPTGFHLAAGQASHFCYGFTASELRRSGAMTARQRRRRERLEARLGRPDPRATERDVAALLATLCPTAQPLELHSDQHQDYPRALRRLPHLALTHRTVSSRAARTPRNPLFPINLLDLLIRHSGANHKRETIAFSKRRQSAIERLWVLLVWRNYLKSFSERKRDATPAMRLGLTGQRWTVEDVLRERLFPGRVGLPPAWAGHYRRDHLTRYLPRNRRHTLRYAA